MGEGKEGRKSPRKARGAWTKAVRTKLKPSARHSIQVSRVGGRGPRPWAPSASFPHTLTGRWIRTSRWDEPAAPHLEGLCSAIYNRTLWTGWLRNCALLFQPGQEAAKSKVKVLVDLVSGEDLPPGS